MPRSLAVPRTYACCGRIITRSKFSPGAHENDRQQPPPPQCIAILCAASKRAGAICRANSRACRRRPDGRFIAGKQSVGDQIPRFANGVHGAVECCRLFVALQNAARRLCVSGACGAWGMRISTDRCPYCCRTAAFTGLRGPPQVCSSSCATLSSTPSRPVVLLVVRQERRDQVIKCAMAVGQQ